ncbi:MAG: tRNA pseudouridine(65) synthase TruC [Roseivirga sp.]
MLEIIYQDEYMVAINKPHGLLVHRSPIATNADTFAVQELRNQLDRHVYPVHRLDRKTSGVLLFALDTDSLKQMQQAFADRKVEKDYLAIVRGYTEDEGSIDYALTNYKGKVQEAVTHYQTLERTEIAVPFGKHNTSRYSLVAVKPQTGRMHQIRKHFAHILHPLIGDRPHGCNKQNRLFKEKWQMTTMLLHARQLSFHHPVDGKPVTLEAKIQSEFSRSLQFLDFKTRL